MRYERAPYASLATEGGGLAWRSSYDPGMVAAFKQAVPPAARKWDPDRKQWLIDSQYGPQVAKLTEAYLGIVLTVPAIVQTTQTETRLIRLEYLGTTKDRGNGESSAFGYVDGGWHLIIPEAILREWFEAVPQRPDEKPTLFATLAVKQTAGADEVRSAYRRLARQWHPDVCREPDAGQVFKAIQHAYEVLGNEMMRRKYLAGLALEASVKQQTPRVDWTKYKYGYRSPLRNGWLLAEGKETLGRFVVEKLLEWQDIVEDGRTMISSWVMGQDKPEIVWQ